MKASKPEGAARSAPDVTPARRLVARRTARARCAACHGALRLARVTVGCARCGALLHADCARDLGRCTTLGCAGTARATTAPLAPSSLAERAALVAGGLLLVSAITLLAPTTTWWRALEAPGSDALEEGHAYHACRGAASPYETLAAWQGDAFDEAALVRRGRAALPRLLELEAFAPERVDGVIARILESLAPAGARELGCHPGCTDRRFESIADRAAWLALESDDEVLRRAALRVLPRRDGGSDFEEFLLRRRTDPGHEPSPSVRALAVDLLARRTLAVRESDDPDPLVRAVASSWAWSDPARVRRLGVASPELARRAILEDSAVHPGVPRDVRRLAAATLTRLDDALARGLCAELASLRAPRDRAGFMASLARRPELAVPAGGPLAREGVLGLNRGVVQQVALVALEDADVAVRTAAWAALDDRRLDAYGDQLATFHPETEPLVLHGGGFTPRCERPPGERDGCGARCRETGGIDHLEEHAVACGLDPLLARRLEPDHAYAPRPSCCGAPDHLGLGDPSRR